MSGALLNYTTSIDPHKTVGEVMRLLTLHGGSKVQVDYEGGTPVALRFTLPINGDESGFRMPVNVKACLATMELHYRQGKMRGQRRPDQEQATRTAWRILKDWIEAQVAILESGMVEPGEVFLPYLLNDEGTTLFELVKGRGYLLTDGRKEGM